ncbi:hypothetical protein QEN19_003624 [Hanseniaspora menglaensis]
MRTALETFVNNISNPIDKFIYVLDGGQGTYLENSGINVNSQIWCSIPFTQPSFWNENEKSIERKIMEQMFKDFLSSGCSLVMTPTYQLNYTSYLKELKIGESESALKQYDSLLTDIGSFTKKQTESHANVLVIGSIGCYGSMILAEFTGNYGDNAAEIDYYKHYKPQLDNFLNSENIDILGFETVPNIHELRFLLSLDSSVLNKPFFIGLSTNEVQQLRDGTPLEEVAKLINDLKAENKLNENFKLIGCNCCSFVSSSKSIKVLNENLNFYIPLIAYPNSGEIYDTVTKEWHKPKNELLYAGNSNNWKMTVDKYTENNCKVIGGCCRTTPEDIKSIHEAINQK